MYKIIIEESKEVIVDTYSEAGEFNNYGPKEMVTKNITEVQIETIYKQSFDKLDIKKLIIYLNGGA